MMKSLYVYLHEVASNLYQGLRDRRKISILARLTPGKLPEQFGGVAWLDVTYSVAGGDLFGGST